MDGCRVQRHGCVYSHDFIGRSSARGSFVVWTHHMKNITYDAAFVPQGAPPNETFQGRSRGYLGRRGADTARL